MTESTPHSSSNASSTHVAVITAQCDGDIGPAGLEITLASDVDLDTLTVVLVSDDQVPEQVALQDLFAPAGKKDGVGVRFDSVGAGEQMLVYARGLPDSQRATVSSLEAVLRCKCIQSGAQDSIVIARTGVVEIRAGRNRPPGRRPPEPPGTR